VDISSLAPLAKTLASAGAPFLGKILSSVLPFPFNLAANAIVSELGGAMGVGTDPAAINAAINANPQAFSEKLQELEDRYKSEIDFANLQVGLDTKEAESDHFFISGWRPTFAWLCIVTVTYQLFAQTIPFHPIPDTTFNPLWLAFGGLLGLRSTEKWLGVAREVLPTLWKRK